MGKFRVPGTVTNEAFVTVTADDWEEAVEKAKKGGWGSGVGVEVGETLKGSFEVSDNLSGDDVQEEKSEASISIRAVHEIPLKRVQDLLCCALEGGSNYWCHIEKTEKPTSFDVRSDDERIYKYLDYPVNPGGALVISADDDDEKYTLNLESIKKGLEVFKDDYHRHYDDFLLENEDATTGDVFLQCCLFGEVVYG